MPLVVTATGAVPAPPASVSPRGRTVYTLTTGDGLVYGLSDYRGTGIAVAPGATGLDAPSYQAYVDKSPALAGHRLRGARADDRTIGLPVWVNAPDRTTYLTRKRALIASLSPSRGLATLEAAEADGTRRRIGCYSLGEGIEGSTARDTAGRTWAKLVLTLHCPDPYWTGDPMNRHWRAPAAGGLFLAPGVPWQVVDSQTIDNPTLDNPGDVDTYPVWTVTGPAASGMRFTRDVDHAWQLNRALAAGETVTVDCRPDRLTVELGDGTNLWPDLDVAAGWPVLWAVPPGQTAVSFAIAGTTGDSLVELAFTPRYETA